MTITRIEDSTDERMEPYANLTAHQLKSRLHPENAQVILETLLVIQAAFDAGVEICSILVDERHVKTLQDALPRLAERDIPVYVASREVLSAITGINVTRGYLACARRPQGRRPQDLLGHAQRLVVLEGLTDVTNVGAVFRSAAALGADGILLAPTCADPLNRRSIRVSMGTLFRLPWARAEGDWPQATFRALDARGYASVALALTPTALPIDEVGRRLAERAATGGSGRVALFFGTEGTGLTREVLDRCDLHAVIPMQRGVDSLNVAASSAVACFELFGRSS